MSPATQKGKRQLAPKTRIGTAALPSSNIQTIRRRRCTPTATRGALTQKPKPTRRKKNIRNALLASLTTDRHRLKVCTLYRQGPSSVASHEEVLIVPWHGRINIDCPIHPSPPREGNGNFSER
uniref:Uncharacterized protein n=1 Tax=Physcomitrium patens TaxID=3218 RepID=A0A2K1ISW3_PHYPA|nr:hypothetical protein PHYPA_026492 [Physcomitrium patens]